jgi:uncharacterized protein
MRVMVIGASSNRDKYGNKAVRAYLRRGHVVLPVNPTETEVEGLTCYPRIAAVPGPIDRATVYLPPPRGVGAMTQLAERGDVGEVWLNPGADGAEVIAEARRQGLRVVCGCSIVDIGERP